MSRMYFSNFEWPGDMHLPDAMVRDVVEVFVGIEMVVLRGDVNVVHVEQNAAVGALDDLAEKFPLGHLRGVELGVAADVLDQNRHLDVIAHFADFSRDVLRRREGVRHGQQVVRVASVDAAPAKMIGKPRRVRALDEALELAQVLAVEASGEPKYIATPCCTTRYCSRIWSSTSSGRPASTMKFSEMISNQSTPAGSKNVLVMRHAQADADAVIR